MQGFGSEAYYEQYVAGGACPACPERSLGEPAEGTPEDARKDGHIRGPP